MKPYQAHKLKFIKLNKLLIKLQLPIFTKYGLQKIDLHVVGDV